MSARGDEDVERCLLWDVTKPGAEAVHEHFGLTYANYLVLRRSMLQCMPNDWQLRFVACLQELEATFDTSDEFSVRLIDAETGRTVRDPLSPYRHPDWEELARRRRT